MAVIKKDEVVEKDVFQNGIDSANELLQVLDKTNAEIKELTKSFKDLSAEFGSQKEINTFIKSISEVDKAKKRAEKTDKDRIKTTLLLQKAQLGEMRIQQAREKAVDNLNKKQQSALKQKQKARTDALAAQKRLEKAVDELTKKEQKEIQAAIKSKKVTIDNANAFKRLSRQVKTSKERLQRLATQYGVTDKKTIKAQKNFERLDNKLRKVNNTAKNGRRDFRSLALATDKLGNTFSRVGSLAAQFGLALGGAQLIRSSIGVLTEFDEKLADIRKTTGLTAEGARNVSKELLNINTRTTITSLQELASAAGRLGITSEADIIGFAKSADEAFVALGDDLGGSAEEIATNLGKIASVFGAEAEFGIEAAIKKTGSSINELAANSKAAAGPILDFTKRMAGVAAQAGISLPDIQALGALFDESGQSIEVASSTLNKLLPALSSNQAEFAKTAGLTAEAFAELLANNPIEALKQVAIGARSSEKGLDGLVSTLDKFGIDSARATGIVGVLANSTDRLTELQKISNDAYREGSSLTEEAALKNDTLGAAFEKLGNELVKIVLGLDDSANLTEKLKNAVNALAENLPIIITMIGRLVKIFVLYKAITSKTGQAVAKFGKALADANGNIIKAVKNLKASAKASKEAKAGMEGGAKAAKGLGSALKSIGFAIAIELVLEFATALWGAVSGSTALKEAEDARAEGMAAGQKSVTDELQKGNKALDKRLTQLDQIAKLARSATNDAVKLAKIDSDLITDKTTLFEKEQKRLVSLREGARKRFTLASLAEAKATSAAEGAQTKKLLAEANGNQFLAQIFQKQIDRQNATAKATRKSQIEFEGYNDTITDLGARMTELNVEQKVLTNETKKGAKATRTSARAQRRINTEFKTQINLVSELNDLFKTKREQEQLSESISRESELSDLDRLIDKKKEEIALNIEFAQNAEQVHQDTKPVTDEIEKRKDLEIAGIKEVREFDITSAQNTHNRRFIDLQAALKAERIELLAQKDINEDEIALVEANFRVEKANLDELEIAANEALQNEIVNIKAQAAADIHEIDVESVIEREDFLNEINDLEIDKSKELAAAKKVIADKELEDEKQRRKQIAELLQESGDQILDGLINNAKKREELIDEEIANSKKLEDRLRESAKTENAVASESLAAQENFTKERIRAKEAEQRKQKALENAKLAIQFISAFIEGGDTPIAATAKGIAQTKIVQKLVEALPGFFKGTKGTVADELGKPMMSGKDGYAIRVDGKEKIFNPTQSAMTGSATTDEIVDGFLYSQAVNNGMLVQEYQITNNSSVTNFGPLEKKIDILTDVLRGKKETTFSKDVVLGIAKGLVMNEKQGRTNTRTYLRGQ